MKPRRRRHDKVFASWLAGFYDGEGSLNLGVAVRRSVTGRQLLTLVEQVYNQKPKAPKGAP